MIRQQKASSCASTTTVGQHGDNDALSSCRPQCFGRLAGTGVGELVVNSACILYLKQPYQQSDFDSIAHRFFRDLANGFGGALWTCL